MPAMVTDCSRHKCVSLRLFKKKMPLHYNTNRGNRNYVQIQMEKKKSAVNTLYAHEKL